jgi:hypothetical protein
MLAERAARPKSDKTVRERFGSESLLCEPGGNVSETRTRKPGEFKRRERNRACGFRAKQKAATR